METIYSSKYLQTTFELETNLLIQDWILSPNSLEEFKNEMLAFVRLHKIYKVKNTLWLQKNFSLELDSKTQLWLEDNVNIPILKYGNQKCAFVIGNDLYAHLTILESFDKCHSCIAPKHFVTEEKARKWLQEETVISKRFSKKRFFFDGLDDEDNLIIRMPSQDIKHTLKSLNTLLEKETFKTDHENKFNLLTSREKEIMMHISKRENHKSIAEKLFISIHTVRTHYKNIKAKLDFESNTELVRFINTYSF
ncbi:response regulator transcription factor [Polaribacter dokdonensis]|jgi:DNA-binding CsgD family transcriptional regulator|nr:helix-turn-helix transcriptional regulator [Polaribacter dokdonensis]KOY51204.1 hypothetical protein I602_764 [Polaribacter dokdonensis DSW-5]